MLSNSRLKQQTISKTLRQTNNSQQNISINVNKTVESMQAARRHHEQNFKFNRCISNNLFPYVFRSWTFTLCIPYWYYEINFIVMSKFLNQADQI